MPKKKCRFLISNSKIDINLAIRVVVRLALAFILLPVFDAKSHAAVVYLTNFESDAVGTLPAGWTSNGTATTSVSGIQNHTGLIPTFSYPDFGGSGSKSFAITAAPGTGTTTVGIALFSGATNQFRFDWSYLAESGLSGSLNFRLYGGSVASDRVLVADHQTDLATQNRTLSLLYPSALNFTAFEISLSTDAASSGGTIFIDDVALQDLSIGPFPPIQDTPTWEGLSGVWSEVMIEYSSVRGVHCEHLRDYTIWTHTVPEPSMMAVVGVFGGLLGLYRKRKAKPVNA